MVDIDAVKHRFESLLPAVDERMRRLIAAAVSSYSVLSAIHDEALSISDAIDQAYGEHVAGKDTQIEQLRARSAKFEQLLSEALRQGWLDESKTSPSWLQEVLAAVAK